MKRKVLCSDRERYGFKASKLASKLYYGAVESGQSNGLFEPGAAP